MKQQTQQSLDVVLYIDDKPLGGQQGAVLNRSMAPIDITNQINASWTESLSGLKSWNVICNGVYIIDENALNTLETAFMDDIEITVKLMLNNISFVGQALIVDYPLNAIYNSSFKYSLKLLGIGELERV